MSRTRVIIIDGFLSAGKTTLLAQAAKYFIRQGKRVGIITNDQAANLVDTHFLSGLGLAAAGYGVCIASSATEKSVDEAPTVFSAMEKTVQMRRKWIPLLRKTSWFRKSGPLCA
jgi:Ni2+-binding GTPase involved in maturation of urease and hydrogenase